MPTAKSALTASPCAGACPRSWSLCLSEPFPFPFFPQVPRSTVLNLAPMLFCAIEETEAKGGAEQMLVELVSRPCLPPRRVITKRSIGWSGRSSKKASMPPCLVGPILPSTMIRTAPE